MGACRKLPRTARGSTSHLPTPSHARATSALSPRNHAPHTFLPPARAWTSQDETRQRRAAATLQAGLALGRHTPHTRGGAQGHSKAHRASPPQLDERPPAKAGDDHHHPYPSYLLASPLPLSLSPRARTAPDAHHGSPPPLLSNPSQPPHDDPSCRLLLSPCFMRRPTTPQDRARPLRRKCGMTAPTRQRPYCSAGMPTTVYSRGVMALLALVPASTEGWSGLTAAPPSLSCCRCPPALPRCARCPCAAVAVTGAPVRSGRRPSRLRDASRRAMRLGMAG